jgi:serine/threonine-protein phosphatase PGAM5
VASTTLYLVRHGEQAHSAAGDDPGTGLSEAGVQQAHLLGERLSGERFDLLRHSPLRRAAETAEVLATYLPDVWVTASDLVCDRTPVPVGGDADLVPGAFRAFLDQVPADERDPGAEALDATVGRLLAVGSEDRQEMVVTHNFVIGWFVRHVLDAPAWRWLGLNQRNCGLTIVRAATGRPPTLVSFNDVGHLQQSVRPEA